MIKNIDDWLYQNDRVNSVRYILGTKGVHPLICFGINPSTAEPNNLDNTLKSVERLSVFNDFDSWIMLNVYPQRATDPNKIHNDFDNTIHEKNLHFINDLLLQYPQTTIWAAWGNLIEKRPFLMNCLKDIYDVSLKHKCRWVTIGNKSIKGHPHHPLYLNSKTLTEAFEINEYIKSV